MNSRLAFLIAAVFLVLPGCASAPPPNSSQPLAAEVLLSYPQCGATGRDPAAVWIDDPRTLGQKPSGFTPAEGGKNNSPFQLDFFQDSALRNALAAVDFSKEGVLLISMGKKPTAGYRLEFESGSAQLRGQVLEVTLAWQPPEPGAFVAQMITSPCLLLKLPAVSFREIWVIDQKGQIQVEARR